MRRALLVLGLLSIAWPVAAQAPEPAPEPRDVPPPPQADTPPPPVEPPPPMVADVEEEAVEEEVPEEHRPALGMTLRTGEHGVRTGDLVHVVITADAQEGDDVTFPEQSLAPFEIHARHFAQEELPNGRRRFRFTLDLLVLEPGQQRLPAIRLRVVTRDGEVGIVRTSARNVRVRAHLGNEPDAQPRPPTHPVPVFEEDYTLLWVLGSLGALLLAALIGFLFARWWRRRPKQAAPPPPPRPPWEVALEELAKIKREKQKLLAEEKQVELVDRVSDVVRHYLGQRYDFNGLESTTDEVVFRLKKVKLRGISHADVTNLLAESDLAKFAKHQPDEAECDRTLEGAVKIVRATTPRPGASPVTRAPSDGSGARIVNKDGEITLPISARTYEEADREIRAASSAAFRDHARDPSFEGTIRIALSPELRATPEIADALRRLHARLSSELRTVPIASGRPPRLVFEHYHERLHVAAREGRPARYTVIDDGGVRVEERMVDAPMPRKSKPPKTSPLPLAGGAGGGRAAAEPRADVPAAASPPLTPPASGRGTAAVPPASTREIVADETRESPRKEREPVAPASKLSVERVVPELYAGDPERDAPLLRWITGLPKPVRYLVDDVAIQAAELGGLGLTRGGIHERALSNLRRAVPPGFAPTDQPAVLDDAGAAVILVLPELVPVADAWIVYPARGEGLVVMRETAASTQEELVRLEGEHEKDPSPLFDAPVRVSKRGFEPFDWPGKERSTNPGFASPDHPVQRPKDGAEPADEKKTVQGDAFGAAIDRAKRGES